MKGDTNGRIKQGREGEAGRGRESSAGCMPR